MPPSPSRLLSRCLPPPPSPSGQLLDILLRREGLGLKAAIVHEEAGCAALGAGVGSACVVDIGSQRASVCCIDEGMPMPGCRQILSYGATDMDALLHTLLHRHRLTTALPPALAAPPSYKPTETALHALRELRHRGCSLRLELDPQEAPSVDLPGSPPLLASAVVPADVAAAASAALAAHAAAASVEGRASAALEASAAAAALAPALNVAGAAPPIRVQVSSHDAP